MSVRLFWKVLVFWIAVLFILSIGMALIPVSENWSHAVSFSAILALALVQLWYVNRKQRADPEAFKLSPRAQRYYLIANIAIFGLFAAMYFLNPRMDAWTIAPAALWGVVALISAYRLFSPPPTDAS